MWRHGVGQTVDPHSIRSSSSRPASRRRSWIARRSRGHHLLREARVSAACRGRGRARRPRRRPCRVAGSPYLDLVGGQRHAAERDRAVVVNSTAPSRAAAMTAGIADPRRLPILGSSGLTRRSTRSEPSAMTVISLTLISAATIASARVQSRAPIRDRDPRLREWLTRLEPVRAAQRPGELDGALGELHRGLETWSAWPARSAPGHASGGRCPGAARRRT